MRSGLLAVILVSLAACESATGLEFTIDATGDRTATEVVVYIGKGDGEAASIAAALRVPTDRHLGRFWPQGLEPESFQLTATERTAILSFAPGGTSSKVTVVAVGLTQGVPSSVATKTVLRVRTDLVERWTLQLEPIKDDVDASTGRAVQRWGEQPGEHTCVQAVDRAATDPELRNIFIGTEGDRDCDGHPERLEDGSDNLGECDDNWHDARVRPSIDTLSCMEEDVVQGSPEQCIVSGRQCIDGESATNTSCSHAVPFCAPSSLCKRCDGGSTAEERFRCALKDDPRLSTNATELPFMRCDVAVYKFNNQRTLCPTRFKVAPPLPATAQVSCTGMPRYHSSDPGTGWTSTATIGGLSVTFSLDVTVPGCQVEIIPTEVAGQSFASSGFTEHGLAAIQTTSRGAIAPLVFVFQDTTICPVSSRPCTPVNWSTPDETLVDCLLP